jgi:hypothetical protein
MLTFATDSAKLESHILLFHEDSVRKGAYL